jgi:ribosome-associated protein
MLEADPSLKISEAEFHWNFVRAGGPGGQNVNKVASKAVLRWNLPANTSLSAGVKERFAHQQRGRITTEGDVIVTSQRFRDQERNRQDCIEKLHGWLRQAASPPKPRRPTKPSRGSREARLQAKRRRAGTKERRRRPNEE